MRLKRTISSILAGVALGATLVTVTPSPASAASCASGRVCYWTGYNYTGSWSSPRADTPIGRCYYTASRAARSVINNTSNQNWVWLFNPDCTGNRHGISPRSRDPELAVIGHSYMRLQ
ncbi:peptidase inhibitor family I36 protein [Micromonospora musae]|uniref:peptidase inhibitor family I36 protein n=1 Tax=Micromonospora musae TaxID=1894970 RepID=UPI00343B8A9B